MIARAPGAGLVMLAIAAAWMAVRRGAATPEFGWRVKPPTCIS